jgi:hypothetical protein
MMRSEARFGGSVQQEFLRRLRAVQTLISFGGRGLMDNTRTGVIKMRKNICLKIKNVGMPPRLALPSHS